MEIIRYIIWTTNFEDTNKIMGILTPHSSVIVSVTDAILCVETKLSVARIRYFVGDEMEMACLEIDNNFVEKLMKTKFVAEEKKNFSRFLTMTMVPNSIDEALDLINVKGGIEFLSERELLALDKLTNKPNPKELPPSQV
jgi:hypothetical protein